MHCCGEALRVTMESAQQRSMAKRLNAAVVEVAASGKTAFQIGPPTFSK